MLEGRGLGGHVSRSFKYSCLREATRIPQDQWMLKNVSCPKLLPAKRRSQLSHLKLQDVRANLGDGTFADGTFVVAAMMGSMKVL